MGIGSSGVVNCANTYLGTANYTVADGYVADRTVIVDGNGPAQLNLNFARDEVLDPRITFSRTSNATRVNAQGLIEYAPHNLLTYSENFDNAAWAKANVTVTANAVISPDGATTADKLVESAVNAEHFVYKDRTASDETVTLSIYAKAGERNYIALGCSNFLNESKFAIFNLTTGERTFFSGTSGADYTNANAYSIPTGNGWFRFIFTVTKGTINTINNPFISVMDSPTPQVYLGDGTSGIYIWGAQLNIDSLQPYYTTSVKNLLGYSQNFENAAWTKINSSVLTNLLTYSQEFDNAVWTTLTTATLTANVATAPDGTTTADKVTATTTDSFVIQPNISATAGQFYTFSVYLRADTPTTLSIFIVDSGGGAGATQQVVNVTTSWQRFTVTRTLSAGTTRVNAQIGGASSFSTGESIYLWGAQLVQGTNPEEYTVTTSAPAPIQVMGPLGFLGAEKLVEDTVNGSHTLGQGVPTIGLPMTYSFYAKAGERSKITFAGGGYTAQGFSSIFNLATGVLDINVGNKASITSVGSGWYRCAISFTPSTTGGLSTFILDNSGNNIYTGDGTSGIYIFGAQLSDSASLDPYSYNFGAAPTSSAYYGPRFDYDPVTLAPKGLLIEEQRTNLLTYSEQFDNAVWIKTNATVTANAVVAPDGTITADKLIDNTTNGFHRISQVPAVVSGITYTFSVYLKAAEINRVTLQIGGSFFPQKLTNFNLDSGTVASGTGTIIYVGNGWYRCSNSATATGSGTSDFFIELTDASGNRQYVGNGSNGVYIWGAQLEVGAFPTSYIPTTSASVTRTADNASMVGTNFSSWYNQSEGTVVVEADYSSTSAYSTVFDVNNGTSANRIRIIGWNDNTEKQIITDATIVQAEFSNPSSTSIFNSVISYAINSAAGSRNGNTPQIDNTVSVPTVNQMQVGNFNLNSFYLNGHIQSIKYFSKRLLNSYLQSLTQ